jgi:hypothetical protein
MLDWQHAEDMLFEAARRALADRDTSLEPTLIALHRYAYFGAGLQVSLDWSPDGSMQEVELDTDEHLGPDWEAFSSAYESFCEAEMDHFGLEEMPMAQGESLLVGRLTMALWSVRDRLAGELEALGLSADTKIVLVADEGPELTDEDRRELFAELRDTAGLGRHLEKLAAVLDED